MLTFGNPLFLPIFAGLAIPVALHLMNRDVPRRLVFPSIRFIQRARLPREGRRSLRDLILLILRLAALALALAIPTRPAWRPKRQPTPPLRATGETVLFVDASASMAGWEGTPRLQQELNELLGQQEGAKVGLVVSAHDVTTKIAPTADYSVITKAIAEIEPDLASGGHAKAIGEAVALFGPSRPHRLIIVSDFQQTDWAAASVPSVPQRVELIFHPVNDRPHGNAAVVAAVVSPSAEGKVRVVAEVRSFAANVMERTVTLRLGEASHSQPLKLPAMQTRKVAFVAARGDVSTAELALDPDPYVSDDSFSLWIGDLPALEILVVIPLETERPKTQELLFVRKALEVTAGAANVTYHIQTVEPDLLVAVDLEPFAALIMLGGAGYLRDDALQSLKTYLEEGGLVLSTPGEAAAHQFHGFRTARIANILFDGLGGAMEKPGTFVAVDWVNPESILGPVFPEPEETDLFLFPVRKHARIRPSGDYTQLLRLSTGGPALIEVPVGSGRLFLSAFAFEPTWSDFPLAGSFLPTIREIAAASLPPNHGAQPVDCGDPIPPPPDSPLGRVERTPGVVPDTTRPGVFVVAGVPYQVNVPRSESVPARIGLADLKSTMWVGEPDGERTAPAPTVAGKGERQRVELWRHCALLGAAMVLLEMVVAVGYDYGDVRGRAVRTG